MKITIDIPQSIIDSFCSQHGYQSAPADDGQAQAIETQPEFFKRKILEGIENAAMTWDANQAADSARQAIIDSFVKLPKN